MCSKAGCQPKQKRHNGHAGTGWKTTKLRKQVAIFFFFESKKGSTCSGLSAGKVTIGMQEQYEIPPNAE